MLDFPNFSEPAFADGIQNIKTCFYEFLWLVIVGFLLGPFFFPVVIFGHNLKFWDIVWFFSTGSKRIGRVGDSLRHSHRQVVTRDLNRCTWRALGILDQTISFR